MEAGFWLKIRAENFNMLHDGTRLHCAAKQQSRPCAQLRAVQCERVPLLAIDADKGQARL